MAEKRKRRWTIPILLPQSRKGRSVSGRNCSLRSGLLALALLPVFDTTSPGKGGGWNRAGARHGSFTPPRFSRSCVQEYPSLLLGNGKHTTHLPQSLLKHLLLLPLLRKRRVQAAQQAELCFCHAVVFHAVLTVFLKIHVAVQLIDGFIIQPQRFL